jgi:hypothetical protein|tara:strand:- start:117 stop:773 length:657 start_codon:yes stop_codon:yes gene_type:complete
MGYFRELPNLQYQSPYSNRISSASYVTAKNIFRRMKIRDDLKNVLSVFNKYEIDDGDRPDTIARDLYGKSNLDWVVLITANIINVRDEWPLSSKELYDFTVSKYGLENVNNIKHYETKEIKNSRQVVILPAGKIVGADFTISYYDEGNITTTPSNTVRGVTNYEYETEINNKKRTIDVLRSEYLQQFLNDIRNEMIYKKSSQFVNDKLIKTENTRITN